jgi:hypothetical protein
MNTSDRSFRPWEAAGVVRAGRAALAVWLAVLGGAEAGILDYQALVQANGSLIHYWNFEGEGASARQADKKGSADLTQQTYGSNPTAVSFTTGWNPTGAVAGSAALTTRTGGDRGTGASGAGLKTADASSETYLNLPSTMTVEAVFRPDLASLSGTDAVAYLVYSRPASGSRGGFLFQGGTSSSESGRVSSLIGSSFTSANQQTLLTSLTPGNWYYAASTFVVSGGSTTITSYIANLSAGQTTLTAVGSKTVSGDYIGDAPLGIGLGNFSKVNSNDKYQSAFPGAIDEVAIYGDALDQATLQTHLTALIVPEPEGLPLLAAVGASVAAAWRWRSAGRGRSDEPYCS